MVSSKPTDGDDFFRSVKKFNLKLPPALELMRGPIEQALPTLKLPRYVR